MSATSPPEWGPDWAEVRALWQLDPDVTYLNHGAWGATPRPVLAEQSRLRGELERDPVDFLLHTIDDRIDAARRPVAELLGADPEGLAFVSNATTGVQTVLSSLSWRPGDQVVTTDHVYAGVRHQLHVLRERHGVDVVEVPVDLPRASLGEVADVVISAISDRTRLVLVDQLASATAMVFPVAQIAAATRSAGVPILVDAAHAPGQLDIDLSSLEVDWWVANLHKWCCTPKGTAVLWAAAHQRDNTHPLVTSHGYGQGFRAEFDWTGTTDPTGWLSAPTALTLLDGIGWPRLWAYQHALSDWGAATVAEAVGTDRVLVPEAHAAMSLVDPGVDLDQSAAEAVHLRLFYEHRIQVPFTWWRNRAWLRLSAQAYNRAEDYGRLAEVLPSALGG